MTIIWQLYENNDNNMTIIWQVAATVSVEAPAFMVIGRRCLEGCVFSTPTADRAVIWDLILGL